jgi:hypothetical protein
VRLLYPPAVNVLFCTALAAPLFATDTSRPAGWRSGQGQFRASSTRVITQGLQMLKGAMHGINFLWIQIVQVREHSSEKIWLERSCRQRTGRQCDVIIVFISVGRTFE